MAQVPISTGPTVREEPLSTVPFRAPEAFGGLDAVGQSLQQTGRTAFAIADQQEETDKRLDEAAVKRTMIEGSTRLRDRLWTGDNAFYSKQGFDAANDRPVVEQEFGKIRTDLSGRLTTPRQREMFNDLWSQQVAREQEGVARYATQQIHVESQRASLARVKDASEDALLNWDDPVKRETFIATAVGEVRSQAADAGWHPDVLHQAERETVSNIYARAAQAKLDRGDVEGAHSLIEGSRDKILPEAQATLDAALKGPLEDRQVDGIVDTIYGTSTPLPDVTSSANIAGNVLPRMVSITTHSESGGRDFGPNGQILTSPKGAQGSMQVMPTTQTDPGYGVRPAKDNSVAEKARVGREYLAALYQHYGRDPAKAWAAYNWGPGNFDNAVEQFGSDVMNHLPRETAAYVAANMAALGGRGVNPVPQQRPQKVDLNTLLGRVDALNLPFDLEHKVKQEVRSRAVLDEGLLDKQRADAQDQAWEVVNNLGKGFTSINQIPVAIRARMSPSAIHSFMSLGETNQHRESTTNWASYAQYSDLYAKNPTAFAALNPAELRTNLSDGDFKEVMGWRQHALEVAQGKPSKDQVTYSRVQGIIDPMMEAAGIFKPPAKRGSGPQRPSDLAPTVAWQQRRGKLMQSVMGDVDIWHQLNPTKQIDDQTIHDIADRQMMRVWQQGRPETAQMAFERPEEAKRGRWTFALPNVDRDRIVDQYRRRWGRDPTSDEVADIYRLGPRGGK